MAATKVSDLKRPFWLPCFWLCTLSRTVPLVIPLCLFGLSMLCEVRQKPFGDLEFGMIWSKGVGKALILTNQGTSLFFPFFLSCAMKQHRVYGYSLNNKIWCNLLYLVQLAYVVVLSANHFLLNRSSKKKKNRCERISQESWPCIPVLSRRGLGIVIGSNLLFWFWI